MRKFFRGALAVLMLAACEKTGDPLQGGSHRVVHDDEGLPHEQIVLGRRLDNPYKTDNVRRALAALYPTKAGGLDLVSTDLYVRFLPESDAELQKVLDTGIELVDHPLDYEIKVDGDWYHDPEIADEELTWQYAVLPRDVDFPEGVYHEIIDECYLPENAPLTRSRSDIDWEAVEREAYVLTGNEDLLLPVTKGKSGRVIPSGRITLTDPEADGGKPIGLAGVRITCNSFVRMDRTYTDRDGYYTMKKKFASKLRYRLVFKNEKGFAIGFNAIFTPASVSTLGKTGPEGMCFAVTDKSDEKLFRRCAVNNAAYDYYTRCDKTDMNLHLPPADLRFWIFPSMAASSSAMLHHGTSVTDAQISRFWGYLLKIVRYFLPDITIGTKNSDSYASIYASVCHELAHASHFSQVGADYWNRYIAYIIQSYITQSGNCYGDGIGKGAGECGVGEMWGYYLSSVMFQERYGGAVPSFGNSFWFHPQIFRYLDERGIERADIFQALQEDVNSVETLKYALIGQIPEKRSLIEQVFNRYR